MKNVMKVVFVISIIMCVLLTPTIAKVSASRGSTRTSTTRLTPVVRAGARADAPSTDNSSSSTPLTPVVRAGARADAPSTNNSSSSTPLFMSSSIPMALFAYLSFVYF
ncbi:hypothetical protein AABB24_011795 [Solanum stoloniferum]|uniref:Uncharacterized protein n=1 Tax=Solanum stoloniferum TaxID=62892 RepID=A0ABD2UFS1_9SOLN